MRMVDARKFLVACIALSIGACSSQPNEETSETREPAIHASNGALDYPDDQRLSTVMERTKRSFAESGGVIRGGDATVGVSVAPDAIELTPYQWESADRGVREQTPIEGSRLRLQTNWIGRSGSDNSASAREARIEVDGSSSIVRRGAIERVHNIDRGVEQSWMFAERPPGEGDLTVRVAVAGHEYGDRTPTGLHFVDASTGLGFAYSDGTWIDADGVRSHVQATFSGDEIVLVVPAEIVEHSAYPVVLDPTVTAEYGFDNPVTGPAVGSQSTPDIAYSGVAGFEYLAVWTDSRRETDFYYDIRGARITAAGTVVDPVGVHIVSTNTPRDQISPAVAWVPDPDGAGAIPGYWFVVWTDASLINLDHQPMIRGIKLKANWGATDPALAPDFDISGRDDGPAETEPDIACSPATGGMCAISYHSSQGGIVVSRHIKNTISAGAADIAFPSAPASPSTVGSAAIASSNVATGPNAFFVVWANTATGSGDIRGKSIPDSTNTLGPELPICIVAAAQSEPSIAYAGAGNGWVVVWSDLRNTSSDIYGRRVANDGATIVGNDFLVSSSSAGVPATGTQFRPSIAGATNAPYTNRWFATWQDNRSGIFDVYGTRLDLSGVTVSIVDPAGVPVSSASSDQLDPALTYNSGSSQFFSTWSDARSSALSPDVYGARISAAGSVLDASGVLLGKSANQQEAPAIASCGGKYLSAWTDTRSSFEAPDIYGAITDDASPPNVLVANIPISTASGRQDLPDVACTGTDFFVVWADNRNATRDVYGARVRASDGVVLDPSGLAISTTSASETDPSIAYQSWAGTYQVAWSDNRTGNYDIYGKRISAAGVVDHTSEISISGAVVGDQIAPDITLDNNLDGTASVRFFVVWQDGRVGGEFPNWDIYGRFVNPNGTMATPIAIATTSQEERAPSTAFRRQTSQFSGRGQLVVFERVGGDLSSDIIASSISPSGNSVVGSVSVTNSLGVDEREPVVAYRSGGSLVVEFRSATDLTDTYRYDIRGQDVVFSPLGVSGSSYDVANASQARERSPAVACGSGLSCQVVFRKYMEGPQSGQASPPATLFAVDRIRGVRLGY